MEDGTAKSRNPISTRLYKILSTNFNDESTREALTTLSDLYTAPKPPTARDAPTYDDEESPAVRARKNLRRDMEQKLASGSKEFLAVFGDVDQKVMALQAHVTSLRAGCDEAETQLRLTHDASHSLLEKAGNLREERQQVETRKSIVDLFLKRFTLSPDEAEAITSRDVPIGKRFFEAVDRTEQIRTDCRVLMAGEDGPTKAGLDIMATTSSHLEQAYDRLARYCVYEFRQVAQLEVSPIMREVVRRLGKRPELLAEALQTLSNIRQQSLQTSFITALTRGGPGGLPRPIELHAHDPLRYIGDMLAWVHQAIAAEREFLESLFGLAGDRRMVGSVRKFESSSSEEEAWTRELMDQAVAKLCVPLRVRVQQTVKSQESSIMAYKIANLLQFYTLTMKRTIGNDALLSKTLDELMDTSYQAFYNSIEAQGKALLYAPAETDNFSLTAPTELLEYSQILKEVMAVYQSSLFGDEDAAETAAGFQRVLEITVDPALQTCSRIGAERKAGRREWDELVYMLNCLYYLLSVLEPFDFTKDKQNELHQNIAELVKALTVEHYESILAHAGLSQVVQACQEPTSGPLSHIPSAQPPELQQALRQFSQWLSSAEVVHSDRLVHLTVQRLHSEIHRAALRWLADSYELLCAEVRKVENRYEAAETMLGSERPFGRVDVLEQVFGLESS